MAHVENIFIAILVLSGTVLVLVASLGVWRMPDLFLRMHAGTKSQTLGLLAILAGIWCAMGGDGAGTRLVLATFFLVTSVAVGAHIAARAAYRRGVPMYHQTTRDEWGTHPQAEEINRKKG